MSASVFYIQSTILPPPHHAAVDFAGLASHLFEFLQNPPFVIENE